MNPTTSFNFRDLVFRSDFDNVPDAGTQTATKSRKRKAQVLQEDIWETYKEKIVQLYVVQNLPLDDVVKALNGEKGLENITKRQVQIRIKAWNLNKNVQDHEMQAIVSMVQWRKIKEPHKGKLRTLVRGREVAPHKIERWMKANNTPMDKLYGLWPPMRMPDGVVCMDDTNNVSLQRVYDHVRPLEPKEVTDVEGNRTAVRRLGNEQNEPNIAHSKPASEDLSRCLDLSIVDALESTSIDSQQRLLLRGIAEGLSGCIEDAHVVSEAHTLLELIRDVPASYQNEWRSEDSLEYEIDVDYIEFDGPAWTRVTSVHVRVYHLQGGSYASMNVQIQRDRTENIEVSYAAKAWPLSERFRQSILENNIAEVHRLIDSGQATVFDRDSYGDLPIAIAAQAGHVEMVQLLLRLGSITFNAFDTHHSILWSIWYGFKEAMNPKSTQSFDEVFERCKTVTSLVLRSGAHVQGPCPYFRIGTLLHFLCVEDLGFMRLKPFQWKQVVEYMLEIGTDVETYDSMGETPLLFASHCRCDNHSSLLAALISAGADPKKVTLAGRTALDLADYALLAITDMDGNPCEPARTRLVMLLNAGCDPWSARTTIQDTLSPSIWASALSETGWTEQEIKELFDNGMEGSSDTEGSNEVIEEPS